MRRHRRAIKTGRAFTGLVCSNCNIPIPGDRLTVKRAASDCSRCLSTVDAKVNRSPTRMELDRRGYQTYRGAYHPRPKGWSSSMWFTPVPRTAGGNKTGPLQKPEKASWSGMGGGCGVRHFFAQQVFPFYLSWWFIWRHVNLLLLLVRFMPVASLTQGNVLFR